MCEYCNNLGTDIGHVDYVELASERFRFGDTIFRHDIGLDISWDDDNTVYINSIYGPEGDIMTEVKVPIYYCPFCGEKLVVRHDD